MNPDLDSSAVVMVTGASSGLGLALARRLMSTTYRLVLTARPESMSRFGAASIVESARVRLRPLDVVDATQRERVLAETEAEWGGVDALVNNAGIAYRSVIEHGDAKAWDEIFDIDVRAPIELIRRVLPRMRERCRGRIINISSVGGMVAMPTMGLYSAAKFALEGATESLWYEMRPWGVRVSLIEPGFIHSDSFRNTRYTQRSFSSAMTDEEPYHAHYQHMAGLIERLMDRAWATPEDVAERIVRTLLRRDPPLRVYATIDAHVFAWMRRLLPRGLYHRVLYAGLPQIRRWGPKPASVSVQQRGPEEAPYIPGRWCAGAEFLDQ